MEKEKNLGEVHQRLWAEIDKRRFDWTHNEKVAQEVEKVTLESFFAFWDRFIAIESPLRRKISFQYFAHAHKLPAPMEKETAEAAAYANEKLVLKATENKEAAAGESAAEAEAAPVADASAAAPEVVFLPPVPLDARPVKYIRDITAFKDEFGLFPASL